jgi:hypothetical protein
VHGLGQKPSEPWHSWSMPGSKQVCLTAYSFLYGGVCGIFLSGSGVCSTGVQRHSRLHCAFHWRQGVGVWPRAESLQSMALLEHA